MRGMKWLVLFFALLGISVGIPPTAAQSRTATAAEREACEARIQARIDSIDSQMRTTYKAREGERLKEKRRKLEQQRYGCRKTK